MERDTLVNIVIPVYNEELRLATSMPILLRHLEMSSFPYSYVITIVDNGSTDSTVSLATQFAAENPAVKIESMNEKGKGLAVRRGWSLTADIHAFMDVDLSSDLSHFKPLIDAVAKDGFDMAIGNRLGATSRVESRRFTRALFSRVFNMLVRIFFRSTVPDHQCGFKAIRSEAFARIAPHMKEAGFFFDTELVVLAQRAGYSIQSVDVVWRDDKLSKVSTVKTSLEMFAAMYAFWRRLKRMRFDALS